MSTTTLDPRITATQAASDAPRGARGARVTMSRVISSEAIKLTSLRSSWYILAAAVVALIGIGAGIGYSTSTSDLGTLGPDDAAASAPLQGYFLAQLFVGALGVLFVSSEYATGMIRSTFAAVPRRIPVIGAKSVVFAAVVTVAMTVASFAAFFAAQGFLSGEGRGASLSDPGALRSVLGIGVYLALVGLLGGALGWIVRSSAGAVSALIGILVILPVIVGLLPGSLSTTLTKLLPGEAGGSFVTSTSLPDTLAPWTGLGVFALWVAGALALAAVLVRRRDA